MLPCNPKISVHLFHLVMRGQFLLPLWLIEIVMCCLLPCNNIRIFLLCAVFASLAPWIMMVTCRSVSFSEHLYRKYFLVLDMVDAVDFSMFYDWIGGGVILHILELRCLNIFWYTPISWLYRSIISLPNMLWYLHNIFLMHSSDDLRALVKHKQLQNSPLPMWMK